MKCRLFASDFDSIHALPCGHSLTDKDDHIRSELEQQQKKLARLKHLQSLEKELLKQSSPPSEPELKPIEPAQALPPSECPNLGISAHSTSPKNACLESIMVNMLLLVRLKLHFLQLRS